MYNDPALPKTPGPPHAAPHTEAFTRTAPQHHCSSRVGTVERPVEDSHTELRYDSLPRNVPVSEFLESLAPPERARQQVCRTDSTKRFFQTLSTFPFQPTDRSYTRWPDKPDAYSLFPRLEEPFLHGPTHKIPSRVGTVTKSCDERTRRKFPHPEERTWRTSRHEHEEHDHPVDTELRLSTNECPKLARRHRRHASESTFPTPKRCTWESSEDESSLCKDGTIRCRRREEFPVCCRPVGSKSYPFTGPSPETQPAAHVTSRYLEQSRTRLTPSKSQVEPVSYYKIKDSRGPDIFGFNYADIENGADQFFWWENKSIPQKRDTLRPQRPQSLEIEKSVLFIPQLYQPKGATKRLRGEGSYFLSDEERFTTEQEPPAQTPSHGKGSYQRESYLGRFPSIVGSAKRNPRSIGPVSEGWKVPEGTHTPSVSKSERLTGQRQPLEQMTPPPRTTLDLTSHAPRVSEEYRTKHQSQVGIPHHHSAKFSKAIPSSLSSKRGSELKVKKHLSKIQNLGLKDRKSGEDKRVTVSRYEVPKDTAVPQHKAQPHERSQYIREQSFREASAIGRSSTQSRRSKQSFLSNPKSLQSSSRKTSGHPSYYTGDKRATLFAARVLGSTNQNKQPRESSRRSRVPYIERPVVPKRSKIGVDPSTNTGQPPVSNARMNAERQSKDKPLLNTSTAAAKS